MEIRVLGAHNGETSSSSCVSLLIDGKLAIEAGGLTSHLSMEEQEKIDAIAITHNHMDHIRDIPIIALGSYLRGTRIDVYSTAHVCNTIREHLLNTEVYPEFQHIPVNKPTISFMEIEPLALQWIDGHSILPVPVKHGSDAVGYEIRDKRGNPVFFTGDTGPGLADCWAKISPQLLIIDVTLPDEFQEFAHVTGHLTPHLLEEELIAFRRMKNYLPEILAIHMDITQETNIKSQLEAVGERLQTAIGIAHEGMRFAI